MTTKKYRCLVVDDEPIARKIVASYLAKLPNVENAGECKNAFEALDLIAQDESIEIVFLDINMPNINGMSMVKLLPRKMQIVFTTAYTEFAIESYDLNAVDYLLKPFPFERLTKAVYKCIDRLREVTIIPIETKSNESIIIKSDGENYPILVKDILYCEAMKNYTRIILHNGKTYLPLIALSKFEEDITTLSANFLRVHRSFLINKGHLASFGANYVLIEQHKIPIGSQYKEMFLERVKSEKINF
jgi:DNA-binding LytR/AlgR family response regulator